MNFWEIRIVRLDAQSSYVNYECPYAKLPCGQAMRRLPAFSVGAPPPLLVRDTAVPGGDMRVPQPRGGDGYSVGYRSRLNQ